MMAKRKYVWEDQTSYSQGERGNVEPRTWEIRADNIRVVVTRRQGLPGWFCLIYPFDPWHKDAGNNLEVAKRKALKLLTMHRDKLVKQVDAITRAHGSN